MKNLLIIPFMCIILVNSGKAQKVENDDTSSKANHFSMGYNLNDFGHDFGVGINITSPYFANKKVAVKISENFQWLNHIGADGKYTWTGYNNVRIGMVSGGFMLNNTIRLYGEGGVTFLISPSTITSNTTHAGGYGLFGFEFFINTPKNNLSYFIELGGIGTGAIADKVAASPIYSNGFMSSVGFRIYL